MSILYLITLFGVAAMLLLMVFDALRSVSRRPDWRIPERPTTLGQPAERRGHGLPFVGRDRRQAAHPAPKQPASDLRDAA